MRIGILAKLSGTTVPMIRSYESAGLLDCGRLKAGFREFSQEALEQTRLILACRSLRWSFPEIKVLMDGLRSIESLRSLPQLHELGEQLRRLDRLQKKLAQGTLKVLETEDDHKLLKIGQLAEQTGLSHSAIDSMVNNGLLPCVRRRSGYRDFFPSAAEHIDLVLALRGLDYTIAQTKKTMARMLTLEEVAKLLGLIEQRRKALLALKEILYKSGSSDGL